MKSRDDFSAKTKRLLAERVNYLCSNPKCERPTIGPHSKANKSASIGVAAHITAAAPGPGAKRYDPNLTKEERASIGNGIWLCQVCAKLIDSDEEKYTTDLLHTWKQGAETKISQSIEGLSFFSVSSGAVTIFAQNILLDQLADVLSNEMERGLEQKRSEWREGKKRVVKQWLNGIKNDKSRWLILDHNTKAKILRFEAGLVLDAAGDIIGAKRLADEAFVFDSSTENEARVRALIARYEFGPEQAIGYLEGLDDIDSKNLLSALYLEVDNKGKCEEILLDIQQRMTPNAETYRLKALLGLATKNFELARREIKTAQEIAPDWIAIKYTTAIINYFSVISPAILSNRLVLSPEPVDWIMVKRDTESAKRLQVAANIFEELLTPEEKGEDNELLQGWWLACIMIDPEKQEGATEQINMILKSNPSNFHVIAWAVARNLDLNLEPSRKALEKLLSLKQANVGHIVALIAIVVKQEDFEMAEKVLLETKELFEKNKAKSLWVFWYTQVLTLSDRETEAGEIINQYGDDDEASYTKGLILARLADRTKDRSVLIQYLEKQYVDTKDPIFLLQSCETEFRYQDWDYVAERAEQLVEAFQTSEILRFSIIATYNSRNSNLCLHLIDKYQYLFGTLGLPADIRRIRAICFHAEGQWKDAILEIEALPHDQQSLLQKAQIYLQMGDLKSLSLIGRELITLPEVNPDDALRMAHILRQEDPVLAKSLWEKATSQDLPDQSVPNAMFIAFNLGLDKETTKINQRFFEVAAKGTAGVRAISLEEMKDFSKEIGSQVIDVESLYKEGRIPIHLAAERGNVLLVDLYHSYLIEKEAGPDPLRQSYLLVRYGGKTVDIALIENYKNWQLHLDITAVLLAAHFNVLDLIEKIFTPLHIPSELISYLVDMRDKALPHQPSQLETYQGLLDLSDKGKLKIVDVIALQNPISKSDDSSLWERRILFKFAQKQNGYILDFISSHIIYTQNQTALTESCVISGNDIATVLFENGKLSETEYQNAVKDLGAEGITRTNISPKIGSAIYCFANIIDLLASAGLLKPACEHFEIYIQKGHLEQAKSALKYYEKRKAVSEWLRELIEKLRAGLESDRYVIIPAKFEKSEIEYREVPTDLSGLQTLMQFSPKQNNDVLWLDDRFLNGFSNCDGVPIIGIYDVLIALRKGGEIDQAKFYSLLSRLRAANLRFIPIEVDEIIYNIRKAKIRKEELIETPELRILKHYVAANILHGDILQRSPVPGGPQIPNGELDYIIGFSSAVADAIAQIWSVPEINISDKQIYSEWIIKNLHVSHLGLSNAIGMESNEKREILLTAVSLASFLSRVFTMKIFLELNKTSVGQEYISWLNERVLKNYWSAHSQVIEETVTLIKNLILSARNEKLDNVSQSQMDLFFQKLCLMLPTSVLDELKKDDSFMDSLGFESLVKVGEFEIRAADFWTAVHKSVNGEENEVTPLNFEHSIIFKRMNDEKGIFGVAIIDPKSKINEKPYIHGVEIELLTDSKNKQQELLKKNKRWFDSSDKEIDKIIAQILKAKTPQDRIEKVLKWKDLNLSFYYSNLDIQLREQKRLIFKDLIPKSIDGMLRYYRLHALKAYKPFSQNTWNKIAKMLIASEGLANAIKFRLWCIPTPLPEVVFESVEKLDKIERRKLIKNLLRASKSPTSLVHIIKMLLYFGNENRGYRRLANLKLQYLLSDDFRNETEAFLTILRWTDFQFSLVKEMKVYDNKIKLFAVWAHAHHLFSIFSSLGISSDWIQNTFSQGFQFPNTLFEPDLSYENDVSHSGNVNSKAFSVYGFVYCATEFSKFIDNNILERLAELITIKYDAGYLPIPSLWYGNSDSPNSLNTFLRLDLSKSLINLVGKDISELFNSSNITQYKIGAIQNLNINSSEESAWASFYALIGRLPQNEEFKSEFAAIFCGINFGEVFSTNLKLGAMALQIASLQCPDMNSIDFSEHLRKQILEISKLFCSSYSRNEISKLNEVEKSELAQAHGLLLDAALNYSKANITPENRAIAFVDICKEMVIIWDYFTPATISIIQLFCESLPPNQAKHMWKLLLFLRAI